MNGLLHRQSLLYSPPGEGHHHNNQLRVSKVHVFLLAYATHRFHALFSLWTRHHSSRLTHTLRKHSVLIVWPLTPPKLNVRYWTLPAGTNLPSSREAPSSPSRLPTANHFVNSSSVQLQLVIKNKPPFRSRGSTLSGYTSHNLLPDSVRSSDKDTASKVPLSRTISQTS